MTRRLALAWASGASLGLVVGFLAGESVRDGLTLRHLARPEPREGLPAGTSATEAVNGAQTGAQPLIPSQRDDGPTLDADGHCTAMSPGGGLRCIVTGPHRGHWWEAHAPDAKADADERIE